MGYIFLLKHRCKQSTQMHIFNKRLAEIQSQILSLQTPTLFTPLLENTVLFQLVFSKYFLHVCLGPLNPENFFSHKGSINCTVDLVTVWEVPTNKQCQSMSSCKESAWKQAFCHTSRWWVSGPGPGSYCQLSWGSHCKTEMPSKISKTTKQLLLFLEKSSNLRFC